MNTPHRPTQPAPLGATDAHAMYRRAVAGWVQDLTSCATVLRHANRPRWIAHTPSPLESRIEAAPAADHSAACPTTKESL